MMRAIDLFAGFGGFTLGATQAGASVLWAADHWPVAVAVHAANHPETEHACQDLRQADWRTLPEYELLLASPACQGHSSAARGNRSSSEAVRGHHDALRATAWAVVDCAEVTQPNAIIVENVPDFARWKLFDVWRLALTRLGYRVHLHELTATDHGVPQLRRRLFVVCLRTDAVVHLPRAVTVPAFGPCVESDAGGWRPIASCPKPRARQSFLDASARHGRCLVNLVTGHTGIPLTEPIRTITTVDQWRVVDGDRYRPLTLREYARGMGFPDGYVWPAGMSRETVCTGLGNAVVPAVARDLVAAVQRVA